MDNTFHVPLNINKKRPLKKRVENGKYNSTSNKCFLNETEKGQPA